MGSVSKEEKEEAKWVGLRAAIIVKINVERETREGSTDRQDRPTPTSIPAKNNNNNNCCYSKVWTFLLDSISITSPAV